MLSSASLVAFAATARAEAAKHFYHSVLGLELVEDTPFALVFDSNGTTLRIQKVQQVTVAPYTALGWSVTEIQSTVRGLVAKGVAFQRYDGLAQDAHGVWQSPGVRRSRGFATPMATRYPSPSTQREA